MGKVHVLKLNSEYFEEAHKGVKPWECRLNDRDYNVGDKIILQEFDGEKLTGREIHGVITFILDHSFKGLRNGYVVFTYKETARLMSNNILDSKTVAIMTKEELLDSIIEDMDDTIDDYKATLKGTPSLVDEMKLKGRIAELKAWRKSLSDIREELSL